MTMNKTGCPCDCASMLDAMDLADGTDGMPPPNTGALMPEVSDQGTIDIQDVDMDYANEAFNTSLPQPDWMGSEPEWNDLGYIDIEQGEP